MGVEVAIFLLMLAVVAIFLGADISLNAAEKIGHIFNIPPLIIGLLIIGLGTSLPEFFVSHLAAVRGEGQMAIGNIVGSNISNLLLILGLSVVIQKISISQRGVFHQIAIHLLLSLILSIILLFNELYLLSCVVLIVFFISYLCYTYYDIKKFRNGPNNRVTAISEKKRKLLFRLFIGFTLLYLGGEGLVRSGVELCRLFGASEYIISVIFIALGTSLPELVTSVLAAVKNKSLDLIVGNVIGSNIFNVAFVMGSLIFYRIDLSRAFSAEIFVLLFSSLCLLIFSYKKWTLGRPFGMLFIGMYATITYYWVQSING